MNKDLYDKTDAAMDVELAKIKEACSKMSFIARRIAKSIGEQASTKTEDTELADDIIYLCRAIMREIRSGGWLD